MAVNAQLQQCFHCKKLFASTGSGRATLLCYKCCWEYDEICKKVQKFQKVNPKATLDQIIFELDIPDSLLNVLMRDKRFNFAEGD